MSCLEWYNSTSFFPRKILIINILNAGGGGVIIFCVYAKYYVPLS
jgi:hypothetical protein